MTLPMQHRPQATFPPLLTQPPGAPQQPTGPQQPYRPPYPTPGQGPQAPYGPPVGNHPHPGSQQQASAQRSEKPRGSAMSSVVSVVQIASVVFAGLVAGLLLAFAVAVMPGLAKVDDQTYVSTMRAINVAILNPVFGLLWAGAPLLAIVTAVLAVRSHRAIPWALAGAVLTIATFIITAAINIPLNDALAKTADVRAARAAFDHAWVVANIARVLTATAACACLAAVIRIGT